MLRIKTIGGVESFGSDSLCRDRPGEVEGVLPLDCTVYIQEHTWPGLHGHAGQLTLTDFHVGACMPQYDTLAPDSQCFERLYFCVVTQLHE